MTPWSRWSLRTRLAVLTFTLMLVPVAALLAIVLATDERVDTEVGPGTGPFETTTVRTTPSVSIWVPLSAALMLVPSGVAAWWWSGRAVKPLGDIATLADEIQQGSLDRRIHLDGAAREVQALGDSFDHMLDRLAEASQHQRQLIEDASHQIRTPLAAVAASAELLATDPDAALDDHRETLERITNQIQRLRDTVDELLATARSRESESRQSDNDLADIVRRVASTQRSATPHIDIAVDGPASLRLGIDGPSVERATANLVENAVRQTPAGGTVRVVLTSGRTNVQLAVIDSGPGIAPGEQERIFDRYSQGDDGTTGSAGIGLAIVKQVADAYGGITVESPLGPDGGTRFTLTLPRSPDTSVSWGRAAPSPP